MAIPLDFNYQGKVCDVSLQLSDTSEKMVTIDGRDYKILGSEEDVALLKSHIEFQKKSSFDSFLSFKANLADLGSQEKIKTVFRRLSDSSINEPESKSNIEKSVDVDFEKTAEIRTKINEFLEGAVKELDFRGGVLVIKNGNPQPLLCQGYGIANDHGDKISDQTVFHLGSVSKQFTAAGIMLLQQHDPVKFNVQQTINQHLPEQFRNPKWEKITIHQLLNHTSGIPNYNADKPGNEKEYELKDVINEFKDKPLDFEPGTAWSYSNGGYALLGAIIEQVSRQTYSDFIQNNIFDQLKMNSSGVGGSYDIKKAAIGYQPKQKEGEGAVPLSAIANQAIHLSKAHAAGSLYSTMGDMQKWDAALYDDSFISKESSQLMFHSDDLPLHSAQDAVYPVDEFTLPYLFGEIDGVPVGHYGYGFNIYKDDHVGLVVSHDGAIPGFKTTILRYPETRDCIIVLSNHGDLNVSAISLPVEKILFGAYWPAPSKAIIREDQNKSKILNELIPSWPIPGTPALVSITDRMKDLGIPGVRISVINDWKVEWSEGFEELAQPGLMAQSASISKTITILTLLCLIEEGRRTPEGDRLTLDTNIQDILDPELWKSISNGEKEPITIRQLMSHTAGLEEDTLTGYRGYDRDKESEIKKTNAQISELKEKLRFIETDASTPNKEEEIEKIHQRIESLKTACERAASGQLPSLDEILRGEGTNSPPVKVVATPGSVYAYAGGGAMILQKVIEVIAKTNDMSNKTYEAIVKEKIFDVLDMKNSTFSPDVDVDLTVQGNGEDGKPLPGLWVRQPELAAAGLWSTPEDLTKVAIAIQKSLANQKGGIINYSLALEMVKAPPSHIEVPKNVVPGLGVFIDKTDEATYFYNSGANLGFRCLMVANDQGQGAVIMTNSELGDELIPEVVRKIAEVYDWKGKISFLPPLHPEVVAATGNSVDIKKWGDSYPGQYENDTRKGMIINVEVNQENGKIYCKTPNPNQLPAEITPISEHVGIMKDHGRWLPIEFTINKDNSFALSIHGMKHSILYSISDLLNPRAK